MPKARVIVEGIGGAVAIGFTTLLSPLLRPWYGKWGTTGDEARRCLPGDELVENPRSEFTCAVTVDAPAGQVWPWLVQLGCGRAGWYSYDLLDNGGVESAGRIIPEYQHVEIGTRVLLTPDGRVGYPVVAMEPGRALVLGGTLNTATGEGVEPDDPKPEAYFSGVNAFALEEAAAGKTRLIFRQRLDWTPGFANTLMYRVFLEPISFVMGRKMLKGIKKRAEAAAGGR
jgi:hypothetical protein